jgi:S1-C subfamily serine protease
MSHPDRGEEVELDDTEQPRDAESQSTEQPQSAPLRRRSYTRIGLAALVAVVVVAIAAGLAIAKTRPTPVGTGVVVIDTNLAYQGGQAAGTGMVLTSSGEVLTNNHVIRGATTIKVVEPTSGRSYNAEVVGYDVSDDVAVLQLNGASNLKTVSLGNAASLGTGQSVTAIGNAGGTGALTSATGSVTGVDRNITVSDDQGGSESLAGLIETNAGIRPGDSGGPLLNSAGQVVGMDTAASESDASYQETAATDGYAIPINKAASIVMQIVRGNASSTIHVGGTAFLGVEVTEDEYGNSGAEVSDVVQGGPADAAGLVPGDVITSVDGHEVASPTDLTDTVLAEKSGAHVSVSYLDQDGQTQTADVALGSGPPR